jgi:hypothetical protein
VGLGALAKDLRNLILRGDTSPDTLSLALSQTDAYKKRFAGNELRRKAGLPELNPAEYIAVEEQYTNVLKAYGLPAGFYDKHEDFTKMIGGDLSPDELRQRAQVAHDQYIAAPAYVKSLWSQYFGTKGDALAAILDPDTATATIAARSQQVGIGGAAAQQGLVSTRPGAAAPAGRRHLWKALSAPTSRSPSRCRLTSPSPSGSGRPSVRQTKRTTFSSETPRPASSGEGSTTPRRRCSTAVPASMPTLSGEPELLTPAPRTSFGG